MCVFEENMINSISKQIQTNSTLASISECVIIEQLELQWPMYKSRVLDVL